MNKPPAYYRIDKHAVMPFLPKQHSTVLEIGCAEGNFREYLSEECEYWGIEPFEPAARIAAKRLDKVLTGTFQEVQNRLPKDYFDLVICNDVIEHMVDHDEFLQSIKNYLKSKGYLVGSIPNVRYISNLFELLIKKDWEYKDAGTLDKTHLRFFTEKSLKRTIKMNGYAIEQFQGINSFPPSIKLTSLKAIFRRLLYQSTLLIFGKDIQFMQFGVRIRLDG